MKFSCRLISVSAVAFSSFLVATPAFAGLKIDAVYDSSINNDPNAMAIKSNINSVISLYESTFKDNITVKVYFQKGADLGTSLWGYYYNNAGVAINALTADATSADDAISVSHLNTNVFGSVAYTTANGRAMGLNSPGFLSAGGQDGFDGIISLNTDACFLNHNAPQWNQFDLYSAAAHEIDEVLGTVSGAGDWLAFNADLFRYDGNGNRSFSGDTSTHAYFSIDGQTNIEEYNQYGRTQGDWGDWIAHDKSQTQDWLIWAGQRINPGEHEFRLLDAVGYDRVAPVPEPASMVVLGLGALGLVRRRRNRS